MKKAEILISIILPVYNAEKFLCGTLDSILSQTFNKFEVIAINDGSNDKSLEILQEYKAKDNRIVVINQDNCGICNSRNRGIDTAKGKYLAFCDHDDTYDKEFLQKAYYLITREDFDFIKFGCKEIYMLNDEIYRENICKLNNHDFYDEEVKNIVFEYTQYNEYIWDGLYKKDAVIAAGRFDPFFKSGCEDIDLMLKLIECSKSCKTNDNVIYNHYIRSTSSTSRKFSENTYESVLKMYRKRLKVAECKNPMFDEYCSSKTKQLLWAVIGMLSFKNCTVPFKETCQRIKQLSSLPHFEHYISEIHVEFKDKRSLAVLLYKLRFYKLLALIILMKRVIS